MCIKITISGLAIQLWQGIVQISKIVMLEFQKCKKSLDLLTYHSLLISISIGLSPIWHTSKVDECSQLKHSAKPMKIISLMTFLQSIWKCELYHKSYKDFYLSQSV